MEIAKWNRKEYHRLYMQKYRRRLVSATTLTNTKAKLKFRHNMTVADYDALFLKQCGLCAICQRPAADFSRKLHLDHDHHTGNYRGLLCGPCNSAIGLFKENIQTLQKAVEYISTWK